MKFTFSGILIFLVLTTGFFFWFGMPPDTTNGVSNWKEAGPGRIWLVFSGAFIVGAFVACFGYKEYGRFPPVSLRWLFVLAGASLMIVSGMWVRSLSENWRPRGTMILQEETAKR